MLNYNPINSRKKTFPPLANAAGMVFFAVLWVVVFAQAATVTKSSDKQYYLLGDTVTWTLVAQPGDAPAELLYQFPMSSVPAGWTTTGGSWAGA